MRKQRRSYPQPRPPAINGQRARLWITPLSEFPSKTLTYRFEKLGQTHKYVCTVNWSLFFYCMAVFFASLTLCYRYCKVNAYGRDLYFVDILKSSNPVFPFHLTSKSDYSSGAWEDLGATLCSQAVLRGGLWRGAWVFL